MMENLIRNLYAVDVIIGCTEEEITFIKKMFGALPPVLENFYRTVAKTEALHHMQDFWMLPEHFTKYTWLNDPECLIILNENQGVCQAGIRREDLSQSDPPVYVQTDDNEWVLSAPSTSVFLKAVMETGGDLQILYGANSEEGYTKLMTVMKDIGEAM